MIRQRHKHLFYIVYDTTPLELPVTICDSLAEVAAWFGCSKNSIASRISKDHHGQRKKGLRKNNKYYTVETWRDNER